MDDLTKNVETMSISSEAGGDQTGNPDPEAEQRDQMVDELLEWVGTQELKHTSFWDSPEDAAASSPSSKFQAKALALMWLRGTKWRLEKAKKKIGDLEAVVKEHFPCASGFRQLGLSSSALANIDNGADQRARNLFGSDAECQDRIHLFLHEIGVVSAPVKSRDRLGRQLLIVAPGKLADFMARGGKNDETATDRARTSLITFVSALLSDYDFIDTEEKYQRLLSNQKTIAQVGFTINLDMKNAPFMVNQSAQREGDRVQKALPARVHKVFVVDPPWFFRLIMAVISKLTSSKMIARIYVVPRTHLLEHEFDEAKLPESLLGKIPNDDPNDYSKPIKVKL